MFEPYNYYSFKFFSQKKLRSSDWSLGGGKTVSPRPGVVQMNIWRRKPTVYSWTKLGVTADIGGLANVEPLENYYLCGAPTSSLIIFFLDHHWFRKIWEPSSGIFLTKIKYQNSLFNFEALQPCGWNFKRPWGELVRKDLLATKLWDSHISVVLVGVHK